MLSSSLILLAGANMVLAGERKQPNIIFILADDLGWNDVSWNNKEMPTPSLEKLAREGVRLDQSYSQQVCTPSRAALLSGKYPFHTGRQKRALKPFQPTGLHLNLTTLPTQLQKLGYRTHMLGKWHLGYCAWEYTPTWRGFDTFLGFYLGSQNHFTHDRAYKVRPEDQPTFYDFRENESVAKKQYNGVYSTSVFRDRAKDLLDEVDQERQLNVYGNYQPFFLYLSFQATHAPLQARAEMLAKIPMSANPARDIYKAMVLDMDLAVESIVATLKEKDLYEDTLIVFTSDNGGAISHGASNWPLRGTKGTLFEGGTRAVTFVHGPGVLEEGAEGRVSKRLTHITDWMPTLLKVAGYQGDPSLDLGLDGVDQWGAINRDTLARTEMVYNLKVAPMSGAVRVGPHKIIFGKKFAKQGWYDTSNTMLQCSRLKKDKKSQRKKQAEGRTSEEHIPLTRNGRKMGFRKIEVLKKKAERERRKKEKKRNNEKKKKVRVKKQEKKKQKKIIAAEKAAKRSQKKEMKRASRLESKLTKMWDDWLPEPDPATKQMLRLRMDECNWSEFSGHSNSTNLLPRSDLRAGGGVELLLPGLLNPFNITAEDEDSEFDSLGDSLFRSGDDGAINYEKRFDNLDIAMYNVEDDPEERTDLQFQLPSVFSELKKVALHHLRNVVEEDFPASDFLGHPRNFQGYFSPGWCEPKYS